MTPVTQSLYFISTTHGHLEVMATESAGATATAIVCHPNSQMGGTMNNKVVTTVVRACQALKYNTVRFNFRGVGQSTGVFDHGIGEEDDLAQVIDWAKNHFQSEQIILAGFSFGAFVALKYCQHFRPAVLLLIAPPVQYQDFHLLSTPIESKNILIVAENDEVVSSTAILDWSKKQVFEKIFVVPAASHFFHGKLILLKSFIESIIEKC